MPPPPRHRAPLLLPVQSHRLPQPPISNPTSATTSNNPHRDFLNDNTNSPSESLYQYYHLLSPNDNHSPIDGSGAISDQPHQPGSVRRARLEAEARILQEYRSLNEDGDSIIDFYSHTTGDEGRTGGGGGGLSSANLSPIDFPHGGSAQHNLLWHHHQQKIIEQIRKQQELEAQNDFVQGQVPEEARLHTAGGIAPSHVSNTAPLLGENGIGDLGENLIALDRDIRLLKLDSATRDIDGGVVQRVIEQPCYPPVPKLTSSPTHFQFSPTITKIPSHASSPINSTHSYSHHPSHHHQHYNTVAPDQDQNQYYEEGLYSSSQAEEDPEGEQIGHRESGSETENSEESQSSSQEEGEGEEMSTSSTPPSWISSFCSLQGHEYFAEVSEEFIEDEFNLTGLSTLVPMYKESLDMIMDVEPDDEDEENSEEEADEDDSQLGGRSHSRSRRERHFHSGTDIETLESQAELLYGLIHQRFITSRQGMQIMYEKYQNNHFGFCPRVYCNQAKVVPCGYSDTPGVETVKLYCPSCMDIYVPPNSRFQSVDGAFFGTTFPALFFLTFPDLEAGSQSIPANISASGAPPGGTYKPSPSQLKKQKEERGEVRTVNGVLEYNIAPGLGKNKQYEMKIYGFKVSERAKGGPRMKWLRSKPDDVIELDETTRWERERLDVQEFDDGDANEDMEEDGDEERASVGSSIKVVAAAAAAAGSNRVEKRPIRRSTRRRQ